MTDTGPITCFVMAAHFVLVFLGECHPCYTHTLPIYLTANLSVVCC